MTLAINSTLLQYLFLFSYFLDGFAYAGEALVGRFFGARDYLQLKASVRNLLVWGAGFGLIFALLYLILGNYLLQFFTKQPEVLSRGNDYLLWVALIPMASFATFIWDGVFIGLTASRAMRNTVLISALFFYFLPLYLLFPLIGNHAIWLAMVLFMLSRSLLLTLVYPRVIRRFIQV